MADGSSAVIKSKDSLAVISATEGKIGFYDSFATLPVNLDLGFIPSIQGKSLIGFNIYARSNWGSPKIDKVGRNPINLGAGVFITKKDFPTNVIGGLAWQFNDVGHDNNKLKQSTVFFYVGYTIN